MMTFKKLVTIVTIGVLVSACSSTTEPETTVNAGFLTDYSLLKSVDKDDNSITRQYKSTTLDLSKYDSVIIEPIYFHPTQPKNSQISTEVANEITTYINENITTSFKSAFTLTNEISPTTARLRVAITGLTIDDKKMSAYQYIPVAFLVTAVSGGLSDMSVKLQAELELTDSTSGKIIHAVSKIEAGEVLDNDKTQLTFAHLEPLLQRWFTTLNATIKK